MLLDEGYDVWMGNVRGNTFSRNHTVLNPDNDSQFWNYSFHEVGIYDLPAVIDYVLKQTKKTQLYYIGQSQGSTSMFVMLSLKPEYNVKIKTYISLAPIAFMGNLKSKLVRMMANLLSKFQVSPTKFSSYSEGWTE